MKIVDLEIEKLTLSDRVISNSLCEVQELTAGGLMEVVKCITP